MDYPRRFPVATGGSGGLSPRAEQWAATMRGHQDSAAVLAHADSHAMLSQPRRLDREQREQIERASLSPGATLSSGSGRRAVPEEPDPRRTCFERDRDRIIHSTAFRRLAGKTQVVVYPKDHQRTRLTHALEVAQVATAIARGVGANPTLAEAIALGHDCGHGPGGHASEDAFDPYLPGGFSHGPWGADAVLRPYNLCAETLDGIRNHSWSRPAPATVEGEIVSWADRIAYCAHDLEDAMRAGIVAAGDLPAPVTAVCGRRRSQQLRVFIDAVVDSTLATGRVSMADAPAEALAEMRNFNYQWIYMRPESLSQAKAMIDLLRALVDHYIARPSDLPEPVPDLSEIMPEADPTVAQAVAYVAGMTDRFAFEQAEALLGYDLSRIPIGLGRGL